jgi:hypothetical protein
LVGHSKGATLPDEAFVDQSTTLKKLKLTFNGRTRETVLTFLKGASAFHIIHAI